MPCWRSTYRWARPALLVAVSGGADSACLLTAIAQLGVPCTARGFDVRAVHVDHRLQRASALLCAASVELCRRLQIPLTVAAIEVETAAGDSIEAAAREARYRRLGLELEPGECLLTAHHAQDQAETLLLQLLRGAGLPGLSAMPMCRPFARGWHLRPLLDVARRDLREFRERHAIAAVDDPMNDDPRFDRSYLRRQVWPLIERRWPGAATALTRTSHHIAEAQELLDRSAAATVQRLRDGDALSVSGLARAAAGRADQRAAPLAQRRRRSRRRRRRVSRKACARCSQPLPTTCRRSCGGRTRCAAIASACSSRRPRRPRWGRGGTGAPCREHAWIWVPAWVRCAGPRSPAAWTRAVCPKL